MNQVLTPPPAALQKAGASAGASAKARMLQPAAPAAPPAPAVQPSNSVSVGFSGSLKPSGIEPPVLPKGVPIAPAPTHAAAGVTTAVPNLPAEPNLPLTMLTSHEGSEEGHTSDQEAGAGAEAGERQAAKAKKVVEAPWKPATYIAMRTGNVIINATTIRLIAGQTFTDHNLIQKMLAAKAPIEEVTGEGYTKCPHCGSLHPLTVWKG
jgi:hypothetical protein